MKIIIIILDLLILCALVLVAIGEPSSRFKINRRYPVVWTSRVSGGSIESEFSHHLVQTIDDIFNKEYCHCTSQKCKCCRHLAPPMFVPKSGLGCAQFKYLGDQTMVVTVKFDDQVIMHKKLSSFRSTPTCMPFPHNLLRFCGKAYSFPRHDQPYKACFVLDPRVADSTMLASSTTSCFQLSEAGLRVTTSSMEPEILSEIDAEEFSLEYL